MQNLAKNVFQIESEEKGQEDKKGGIKFYFGLMAKTLSLPSPVDSETTSLSSCKRR